MIIQNIKYKFKYPVRCRKEETCHTPYAKREENGDELHENEGGKASWREFTSQIYKCKQILLLEIRFSNLIYQTSWKNSFCLEIKK